MLCTFLITILVGALGSWAFYKMRVPAGAMVGAIIFVGMFQISTGHACFPSFLKTGVQAIVGGFVGQRITMRDLKELRSIVKPSIELFVGISCLSICTGIFIHTCATISISTALLASIPGGITDVALIAADVGADSAQATVLQMVRYLLAILILPQVGASICNHHKPKAKSVHNDPPPPHRLKDSIWKDVAITFSIVAVAGVIGKWSGIPAGAMVAPMFAVSIYNVLFERAYIPKPMKISAQCLAGINIGVTITLQDILGFHGLLYPALFVALNCILTNYLLGFLIYKTTELDLPTSLYSCVPAGMSDMALISLEQGGDAPKVAVLQLVRYVCVMVFMPPVIKVFSSFYPF